MWFLLFGARERVDAENQQICNKTPDNYQLRLFTATKLKMKSSSFVVFVVPGGSFVVHSRHMFMSYKKNVQMWRTRGPSCVLHCVFSCILAEISDVLQRSLARVQLGLLSIHPKSIGIQLWLETSPGRCRWHTCGRGCAGRAGWPRVWRTSPGRPGRSAASPGSPWSLLHRHRDQNCLLMREAWSQGQSSSRPGTSEWNNKQRNTKFWVFWLFLLEFSIHTGLDSSFYPQKLSSLLFLVVFSLSVLALYPQLSIPLPLCQARLTPM